MPFHDPRDHSKVKNGSKWIKLGKEWVDLDDIVGGAVTTQSGKKGMNVKLKSQGPRKFFETDSADYVKTIFTKNGKGD